jgi:hypothetical protein
MIVAVDYFDPRAEPSKPAEPYLLSVDITAQPATVGLIANNFIDSTRFMDHVEAALLAAIPTVGVLRYTKPDTSPATADLRREIFENCTAVVSAYGH